MIPFIVGLILVAALLFATAKVVPQNHAWVLEFLGKYMATWEAGLHFRIPVLTRIVKKVSLKEQVLDFPPPECYYEGQCRYENRHCSVHAGA